MLPIGLFPLYAVPIVHAGKQSMCFQLSPLSIHRTLSLLCIGMIRFAACITFFSARSCLPAVLLLEISSPGSSHPNYCSVPLCIILPSFVHLSLSPSLSLWLLLLLHFGQSVCRSMNALSPFPCTFKSISSQAGQWKLIEGINQTPAILSVSTCSLA